MHRRTFYILALVGLLLSLLWPGSLYAGRRVVGPTDPAAAGPPLQVQVDPLVLETMAAAPDGQAGFFVLFAGQADLFPAYRIDDWALRGRFVYDALQSAATQAQAPAREWLQARGIPYTPFLSNNSLFVTADRATMEALVSLPGVVAVRGNHQHELEPRAPGPDLAFPTGVAWSITQVGADRVWDEFGVRGQSIVVANIDTGVEYTHPALFDNYKCGSGPHDECWYDPSNVCGSPSAPCDNVGHGTHTMGTMVGDDDPSLAYNVGMAPRASWIACKGCENNSCSEYALLSCADWVLAPGGDAADRPHVVNNSWGGGGCDSWYQSSVQAWRAAGIFPAFSAGNSGSSCGTLGSPGDLPESFNSGAVDSSDSIAYFSSRGPSCWGEVKPEVTAPGVDVCSSVPGNGWDCSYSGTSMASPHTAGLVALLWSARPSLVGDIPATEYLITSTATCIPDSSCGGSGCPNNVYGWGRIDAYAAVRLVVSSGVLAGTVTDQVTSAPLPGTAITARSSGGSAFEGTAGPSGAYSFTLPAGVYTVSASLYSYYPQTVTAVLVVTDVTTVQDFGLQPLPRYTISGTVVEAETGLPLQARIAAEGTPLAPAWSDPLTGYYSLTLVAGSYSLRASALLHLSERIHLQVDEDGTANFQLESSRCALLVDDDDNRPDVRSYYTSTLDQLGLPYRVWDVAEKGPVGSEDLMGSRVVIWWTGADRQDTLTADDEAALAAYLDGWGNLFLSSAGYLNETEELLRQQGGQGTGPLNTTFQERYLRLASYSLDVEQNDPVGNRGDPIGDGLGPFLLVPPEGWDGPLGADAASPAAEAGASAPFRWQTTGMDNSTDYDAGSFKTIFLAWPLEGLAGPSSRRAVLESALEFFGACQPVGLLLGQVTDANTGAGLAGASVMPVREGVQAAPTGSSDADGYFTFTLPAGSYEVTVYQPGYAPEVLSAISVPAGMVTRLDVALRSPRLSYRPDRLAWEIPWEGTATATVVLSNSGTAAPLEWEVRAGASPRHRQGIPLPRAPLQRLAGGSAADEPPAGRPLPTAQPAGWDKDTPLPTALCRGAAFTNGADSVFAVGGYVDLGGKWSCQDQNLRYDASSGEWAAAAPLPLVRANVQAAVVGGVAYLPGGYCDGYYYNDLQAYDLESDRWLPGLAPLPQPRSGNMVAALDGLVYSCGGSPSGRECWAYDPAHDSWEQVASLPQEDAYGAAVEYGGFIYLVGGIAQSSPASFFWRYDPALNSWSAGPAMHVGRMSPSATVYGGYLYLSGGGGNGDLWYPYDSVERYPLWQWPAADWEYVSAPLSPAVVAPFGSCLAGRLRAIGGWDGWGNRREHQALDEELACYQGGAEPASWVTPAPTSGTLGIGQAETITLSVDAGAVDEPGCYDGALSFYDNSVYEPGSIPLTLCVVAVPDLGKVSGSVQGLGYCDRYPEPLRAEVRIQGSGGLSWTLATAADGTFFKWLHAGVYTVSVGAPDYIMQRTTVQVRPAQTETLDVDLHYLTRCLDIDLAPVILYAPTGTLLQRTLVLTNAGDLALSWQAVEAVLPSGMAVPMGRHFAPSETDGRAGGPDPFGYTYRDSNVPGGPTFAWLDASGGGKEVPVWWSSDPTITLPFSFSLYGASYTPTRALRVSPYGLLYFSGEALYYQDCLPEKQYTGVISPWWDYLGYGYYGLGKIFYSVLGEAPHRTMVVEWYNVHDAYYQYTDTISLEAVLFEGSDDILFQYADVMSGDPYEDAGADAGIGIQGDGHSYLEYSCHEPVLTDSLSICFEPPGSVPGCGVSWEDTSWLSLSSSGGRLSPGRQAALNLLIDTTGLQPGPHRAAVGITSDDPRRPAVYIPITLVVGVERDVYLPLVP